MNTIAIYSLSDPRDNTVKYIGRTSNVKLRYSKHCSIGTNVGTPKNKWVRELRDCNLKPVLEVLENVTKDSASFWERWYTQLYRSWGFDLLNNIYREFGNQTSFKPGEGTKSIVAIDLDGNIYKKYKSQNEAYVEFGGYVSNCIAGRSHTSFGYMWMFEEDYNITTDDEIMFKIYNAYISKIILPNSGQFKKGVIIK